MGVEIISRGYLGREIVARHGVQTLGDFSNYLKLGSLLNLCVFSFSVCQVLLLPISLGGYCDD